MNLPPRTLALKVLEVKNKAVLALDTGFEADSLEGLRLVKASRGSGWFYHAGVLSPWTTRGVLQEDKRLVVWGDLDSVPQGSSPGVWPREGTEGRAFLTEFVRAWTARAAVSDPLPGFSSSSVVPFLTPEGWSFAFLPPELKGVLDSLQPLGERLAWDHFRLPEASGPVSWAFASAALGWDLASGSLPWAQEDEAHLRQEIRDLKKTLSADELPEGPDPGTRQLWLDSLAGKLAAPAALSRWKAWVSGTPSWDSPADPARAARREAAAARRTRRRSGASFWRRKGTLTLALSLAGAAVLAIVGSIVWDILKPDPTDDWTAGQVVEGYYQAMAALDADTMKKITRYDGGREPALVHDQDEVSNIFVIRQVRTAYEHKSPVIPAADWENQDRPALEGGQILYGPAGVTVTQDGEQWLVRYRKWASDAEDGKVPVAVGFDVSDTLTLVKTGKGWKISHLQRQRQPLP